jgi:hypothetical protein
MAKYRKKGIDLEIDEVLCESHSLIVLEKF